MNSTEKRKSVTDQLNLSEDIPLINYSNVNLTMFHVETQVRITETEIH